MKKRYAILTSSNRFPRLGAGASLLGCDNDTSWTIHGLLNNAKIFPGGFDKVWALTEGQDNSDHIRDIFAKAISELNDGDQLVGPFNSSHGTHYTDYITGQQVSCTVCYNSAWGEPRSFISKLDYQRAFEKLKAGVRVWTRFDSCESGNMGQAFKFFEPNVALSQRSNRFIAPPPELLPEISRATVAVVQIPKQVCTMAGCTEKGTCSDIHDARPHGAFSETFDSVVIGHENAKLSWRNLAREIDIEFARDNKEQRTVVNGPDFSLGSEK